VSGEDLLRAMAAVYASCTSYRDRGEVRSNIVHGDEPIAPSPRPFETAFVHPGRFRFEFRDQMHGTGPWNRYIVWTDGLEVRTHWDLMPQQESPASLGYALAGATGISGGSAHRIPALLMPDRIEGFKLTDLVEVELLGTTDLDGDRCYQLRARMPAPSQEAISQAREVTLRTTGREPPRTRRDPMLLWIDAESLLLRREEEHVDFEWFSSDHVTTYYPELNVPIPEAALEFDVRNDKTTLN
jgi:hypothetical protein